MVRHAEGASSTTIEDIHPSPRRLARASLAGPQREPEAAAIRNMKATETAMSIGGDLRRGPLTVADICQIHQSLMHGDELYMTRHEPGSVRVSQNWIGGGNLSPTPDQAIFVSPPPETVPALLEDLAAYMNDDRELPLIQSSIAHARFEHIHPFPDGNGRTGRALVHMLWARRSIITANSTIPVSAYLAKHKDAYFGCLSSAHASVCAEGSPEQSWGGVVDLFASAGEHGCDLTEAIRFHVRKMTSRWAAQVPAKRRSVTRKLLESLPRHPVVDAADVSRRFGCTERRAQQSLQTLAAAGILQTRNLAKGRRAHEAVALLNLYSSAASADNPHSDMAETTAAARLSEMAAQEAARAGQRRTVCGAETARAGRCQRPLGADQRCPHHGRR